MPLVRDSGRGQVRRVLFLGTYGCTPATPVVHGAGSGGVLDLQGRVCEVPGHPERLLVRPGYRGPTPRQFLAGHDLRVRSSVMVLLQAAKLRLFFVVEQYYTPLAIRPVLGLDRLAELPREAAHPLGPERKENAREASALVGKLGTVDVN